MSELIKLKRLGSVTFIEIFPVINVVPPVIEIRPNIPTPPLTVNPEPGVTIDVIQDPEVKGANVPVIVGVNVLVGVGVRPVAVKQDPPPQATAEIITPFVT